MVETESYIGKLIEVLLAFGVVAASLYAIFWLIFQPEWDDYGGVTIRDPFSGFVYYLDDDEHDACVTDIVHTLGARNGCLKIPESFWGRPVNVISMQWSSADLKRVQTIEIPDSVITIEWLRLSGVEELTGGENVVFILGGAFEHGGFKKVSLGDSVSYLGEEAFSECVYLEEVNLGKGLENIEDRTFYGCTSLKQIQLGYNVTWVGEEAFAGCTSLETVTQTANLRSIHEKAFDGTPWSESEEGKAMISAY